MQSCTSPLLIVSMLLTMLVRLLMSCTLNLQAQEQLLEVDWPAKLLEHPYCAPVHLGAACVAKDPNYKSGAAVLDVPGGGLLRDQGPLLMAGLRVRMGINTGWSSVVRPTCSSGTNCTTNQQRYLVTAVV